MEKVGLKAIFETADFQRGIAIYNSGISQINNNTKAAAAQSQQAGRAMGMAWQTAAVAAAAAAASIAAAYGVVSKATKMAEESARARNIEQSFYVMAAGADVAADQLLAAMDRAARGTVESTELMRIANRAFLLDATGTFAQKLPQIMEIARATSLATGQDFLFVLDTLTKGIAKASPLLIDNAEIYIKVGQAVEEAARKQGRAADDLSTYERQQAILNAVVDQGADIVARFGEGIEDQTEPMQQVRKEWVELRKEIGEGFIPIVQDGAATLVNMIDEAGEVVITWTKLVGLVHANFAAMKAYTAVIGENQAQRWLTTGKGMTGELDAQEKAGEAATAAIDAYNKTILRYTDLLKPTEAGGIKPPSEIPAFEPPDYTKAAEAVSEGLDKIRKLQEDYYRDLARMEADYNKDRAKDEQKYLKSVEKEREKQAKQFDKATAAYEKQRAKTIIDFQKQVTEAESGGNKERIKAAVDFARQERQERERYQLDRVQGERRYQFEKAKSIAEGDTLAIEELNARYELEKQESAENEDLRSRQAKENQATQITEAGEAAREQLNELKQQLDEQLAEQDEAYKEQVTDQQAANAERLADMAEAYQEQTAAREEQYAEQKARRDEDHQRQLEDLGEALANQEELQKYGADQVANVLQQYYGEGGVADSIMQGWHEREAERVILTSEMLAAMSAVTGEGPEQAMAQAAARRAALATHGRGVSMDEGGVVTGPATVRVGSGLTEAFVPLSRAGGNLNVSWTGGPIPIMGLERGSPGDVNAIARGLAETLTARVRLYRRS